MYGSVRLGGYRYLFNEIKSKKGSVSTLEKTFCSLIAGLCGSLVGNPADLVLVRM